MTRCQRTHSRCAVATKESLIRSATELFAHHGLDGVSVESIAQKAGVNKALINYHFGGKERLYTEILRTTLAEARRRVDELRDSSRSPEDVLRDFVAAFHNLATVARPHFPALLLREVLTGGRRFDEEIVPHILGLFEGVAGVIERGVREGVFRPVHPFLAHLGIIGSLVFFYATEPRRRRIASELKLPVVMPTANDFVAHIQEVILYGIAAGPRRTENTQKES
ncbi:MAG: TetR/AcrR family transcriptional regulator [Vicinamibacteria bacterium]|nr:TetR/AcrR family transcriptional regulator [Vicinamibacteria bacterium]